MHSLASDHDQTAATEYILLKPTGAAASLPAESDCLLVLFPGALLTGTKYKLFAEKVQQSCATSIRLWVVLVDADIISLYRAGQDPLGTPPQPYTVVGDRIIPPLLDGAKAVAEGAGFKSRGPLVRCENMVVAAHSLSSVMCTSAAFKSAGAMVLIAGIPLPGFPQIKTVNLEDWSRPILFLCPELDGLMRVFACAKYALDMAACAERFGARYAAAMKPWVVLRGAGHEVFTDPPVANTARGSVPGELVDHEGQQDKAAQVLGHFLTAHYTCDAAVGESSITQLLAAAADSLALMEPWAQLSGYGPLTPLFQAPNLLPPSRCPTLHAQDPPHISHLRHQQRVAGQHYSEGVVHPGLLHGAEHWVGLCQRRVLQALGEEVNEKVHVVVSVHVSVDALLYNQPEVLALPDGRFLIHAHALLYWPAISDAQNHALPHLLPTSPQIWMKMKNAAGVALAMGIPPPAAPPVTATALNTAAMEAALQLLPEAALQRYNTHGRQLVVGEDIDWVAHTGAASGNNAVVDFMLTSRLSFTAQPGTNKVVLRSPMVIPNPPPGGESGVVKVDPRTARFLGNVYMKVMSPAMALEWACLDAFRPQLLDW